MLVACRTTEGVEDHGTGRGYPQSNPLWQLLVEEITTAQQALASVNASFALGTNGWCLGPGDNASFFADVTRKDTSFKISSINGILGWLPPDPAYASVDGERSWVIPWMEDDLALAGAELWVNRTIEHARVAHEYGASGLLGLMWRTWEIAPQIAALGRSAWSVVSKSGREDNALTDVAVYTDFCSSNFGHETAAECASLFLSLDSFSPSHPPNPFVLGGSKIPRDGQACCGGPMDVVHVPDTNLLDISNFEVWLPKVTGAEQRQRATAWVDQFRYHRMTQLVSNHTYALQSALQTKLVHDEASALAIGVPLAQLVVDSYTSMITFLLGCASTPGTLGMLAAHEGANWPSKFGSVVAGLGQFLPSSTMQALQPPHTYCGAARLFPSHVRTVVAAAERFEFEVTVLSASAPSRVVLTLGGRAVPMEPVFDVRTGVLHSQVYAVSVPLPATDDSEFSYFVTADIPSGPSADSQQLRFPLERNETVVVI